LLFSPLLISALLITHLLSPGDICRLPPEIGPCKGQFPRFFYNPASRKCEIFIYGGCGGNGNNFRTLLECEQACKKRGKGIKRVNPLAWAGQPSKLGQPEN
uniref:BPTI/Kunitz inhibitor domain-containing protein n=1 Tax=Terrapene triunguis TaxID=2587831 RepID=A0A674JXV5_9SAUR